MLTFWILAFLLAALGAAFVLVPMRYFRGATSVDRTQVNVAIFKEKLAALDEGLAAGELEAGEYATLKLELEQSLLTDVGEGAAQGRVESTVSQPAVALISVLVPAFAFLLYAELGSIEDVAIAARLDVAGGAPHDVANLASMDDAVETLYQRLQSQPENHEGWFLVARSFATRGNFERAADAFGHLAKSFPEDLGLLSYQAESLYMADRQQLTPRVRAVVDQGLALDPSAPSMVQILGLDAYKSGNTAEAIAYFNRVLAQPDIGDDRREFLEGLIREAGGTVAAASADGMPGRPGGATGAADPATQKFVNVLVELGDAVSAAPGDTVFVFARAVNGPPMPLAAKRITVADLPAMVRLDESMAMNPAFSLATANEIQVVARITKGGGVRAEPGDWEAASDKLTLAGSSPVVKLLISRQVTQ